MYKQFTGFLLRRSPFFIFTFLMCINGPFCLYADTEEGILFSFGSSSKLKITERSNVSVYENGVFKGLTYNESRAVLEYMWREDGFSQYSGNYYVYEASRKDTRLIANPLNLNEICTIEISDRGVYRTEPEAVVPVLRSFPVFPEKGIQAGDSWRDYGERIVDPENSGTFTRVRFFCEYRYQGIENGRSGTKHVINAQYAMRYDPGDSALADPSLDKISGRHVVNIYIDVDDRSSIFIRDKLDEQYNYSDGKILRHTGFILTWYNDVIGLDRTEITEKTKKSIDEYDIKDVDVIEKDEGIALSINSLHFIPDSPKLLAGENARLKDIYGLLSELDLSKILVVGHTADVGSIESQNELSKLRALTVIEKLTDMGMNPSMFMYEGRGGDEPVADNGTDEGRAANRRVELILLDD
ncbi:MAG: OmpA family protein [Spirochaetales bacterium]|uniref:OmpA family protein n=1 Tax=Candidatus Thalassospirochaeta sargassi TaxID=3119039 RepID=A0AAJ1ICS9_9SPIO|nr:OmpA family protein [Spirochaetales bacterium]